MRTKLINGVACMVAAALCAVGTHVWIMLDGYWMAGLCALSAVAWIYYAMRAVE